MSMMSGRKSGQRVSGHALLSGFLAHAWNAMQAHMRYRRSMRALRRLDDHGLRDIGVILTPKGYRLGADELGRHRRAED